MARKKGLHLSGRSMLFVCSWPNLQRQNQKSCDTVNVKAEDMRPSHLKVTLGGGELTVPAWATFGLLSQGLAS